MATHLFELFYVDVQLTAQLRLGLRECRDLTGQLASLVHLLLLCFPLLFVSCNLILNLEFLCAQERVELKLPQLVLINKRLEL